MHVVIVDPSRVVQSKLAAELEAAGNYVDCFSNSDLALRHVAKNRSVDVVVTSLELEPISGLEMCWELRLIAGEKRPLHIIAMSSNNTERALSEALDCGADDFMVKPVGREELRARLRAAGRIMTLQRELLTQLSTDPVTGRLNRRAFEDDVAERRMDLDPADHLSICLCHIDHYKRINEQYGRDIGDEVVRVVGNLAIEEAPVVARLGSHEFAFAFPILDPEEAARWCDVIRENVARQVIETPDGPLSFTLSLGVSEWNAGEPLDAAIKRADQALAEAKRLGRNRVHSASAAAALVPAA